MDLFGKKKNDATRFDVVQEDFIGKVSVTILRDTKTGVQYMFTSGLYCGGLTPLLDAQGNPVRDEEAKS